MTQRQRFAKKIEMRDYRNRKRLAEFKVFVYALKEKVAKGEMIIPADIQSDYQHACSVAARI